jgi:hypothetical protein
VTEVVDRGREDGDSGFGYNRFSSLQLLVAPLAQLDRASGYEPEGREFESLRAHHLRQCLAHFNGICSASAGR